MDNESKATKKNSPPIKVYCLPEERQEIAARAKEAGLSLSAFLLASGQGHQIKSVVDYKQVTELAKINGDLGRLGGLLKFWLTGDPRVAHFNQSTVRQLLKRIEATQDEMAGVMKSIVRPKASDKRQLNDS